MGIKPKTDDYEPILWVDTKVGDEVWLSRTRNGEPCLYGPHLVADPKGKLLLSTNGGIFPHYPEGLYKQITT